MEYFFVSSVISCSDLHLLFSLRLSGFVRHVFWFMSVTS
jgi:hypothetical protein